MWRNLKEKSWENQILELATGLKQTWKWIAIQKMMSPLHHFKQHGSWPPTWHSWESLSSLLARIINYQTQSPLDFVCVCVCVPPTNFYVTAAEQICVHVRRSQQRGRILPGQKLHLRKSERTCPSWSWRVSNTNPDFGVTGQQRYAKDEILQTESVFSPAGHIPNTWPWQPRVWPLYKIRPFVVLILPLFKANFNPGWDLSIDEAMIGYKGRIFFKQCMPAKPTKWA